MRTLLAPAKSNMRDSRRSLLNTTAVRRELKWSCAHCGSMCETKCSVIQGCS